MRSAIQLLEGEILVLKEKEASLLRDIPYRLRLLEEVRREKDIVSSQIDGLERALIKLRTPSPSSIDGLEVDDV